MLYSAHTFGTRSANGPGSVSSPLNDADRPGLTLRGMLTGGLLESDSLLLRLVWLLERERASSVA